MAKTVIIDIRNNTFAPATIEPDTYVVWRNLDPHAHSAETVTDSPYYFNAGALLPGELSSPVWFAGPGVFEYVCRFHTDMRGAVQVGAQNPPSPPHDHGHKHDGEHGGGHHGGHLLHFHGFVTGGRSAQRMYMTHTPVLADERHCFQVILQGSLADPKHAAAYEALRQSAYGHGKVQIFHDHLALPDIGSGQITTLPRASFEYYPADQPNGAPIPGLEENIPVKLERVIHFHQFELDADYPAALTYLVYGDEEDAFLDHYMNRAPSFHSVAKLQAAPSALGAAAGRTVQIAIPEKRIRDVSPKIMQRVAFVDNSFHLFWLPPTGVYPRTLAQDPLIRRNGSAPHYECVLPDGSREDIEIQSFLHFDVRLLNYGVFIL